MAYVKPRKLHYRIAQGICWVVSKTIFRNQVLRNEIKGKDGPFVVIANHQCAYDFVNLICACSRPMSFVISKSFFSSLPVKGFLEKMGVIPKQQFQTTVKDMKSMKSVIDNGQPLVIYPAGLMCEDGLSTPIPGATYKFLKWLGVDVYVARSYGSYFVMPKWTSGMRPGRTFIDIYKLIDKEDLAKMDVQAIQQLTDDALLYDAYREQERNPQRYAKSGAINGIEQVLYVCPQCGAEFSIAVKNGNTLHCAACGYQERSDEYGFLHNDTGFGPEIRYISDWSRHIHDDLKRKMQEATEISLSADCGFQMISPDRPRFVDVGNGSITLRDGAFHITGIISGEAVDLHIPVTNMPTLPFSPGKYLEIQDGSTIYRCVLNDGKLVAKFINMVKIFYELRSEELIYEK